MDFKHITSNLVVRLQNISAQNESQTFINKKSFEKRDNTLTKLQINSNIQLENQEGDKFSIYINGT